MPEPPAEIDPSPTDAEEPAPARTGEARDPGPALLDVQAITLTAGSRTLVKDLSLALHPGDRLVVVGGNGSGKSTLLAALVGLVQPAAGTIRRPTSPPGMLFQDGGLWPHLTVAQHLEFVDTHNDHTWRQRLLETFGLAGLSRARPETLSGGERLRLGLARALGNRPRWILLDEPLAHLDPQVAAAVRETFPMLVEELGAATIVVTHDPDDVMHFGDRMLSLTGHGGWWMGSARFALESPPTATLAAFSGMGTILSAVADDEGCADFGLGIALHDCPPRQAVMAYLDAAAVHLAEDGGETTVGQFVAPDRRGGSWVRVDDRLLHSADTRGPLRPGDLVRVRIEGRPRRLSDEIGGDQGSPRP